MTRPALLVAAMLLSLATTASAQPAGLRAGDTYHLVLVTSNETSVSSNRGVPPAAFTEFGGTAAADWVVTFHAANGAAFSDIEEAFGLTADEFTTGDAAAPWDFLATPWQAILSDSGQSGDGGDAITRLDIQGPIYNTRGELVAADTVDLFDGAIDAPILYDETGAEVTGNLDVWSGTAGNGLWTGASCDDWDDPSSTTSAEVGAAGDTSSSWVLNSQAPCNQSARLYGLSPAFTVPVRGDFTGDGVVDAADYTVWRDSEGQTGAALAADANGDLVVDQLDYDLWALDFGYQTPASEAVPEPASLVILAGAVAALIARVQGRPTEVDPNPRTTGGAAVASADRS